MPAKTVEIQTNFTAGELSPRMEGRVDVARVKNGVRALTNWKVYPQGGVARRPGTEYIAAAKYEAAASLSRLVPFVYSITQAYMLEFSQYRIRIFKDGAQVTSGGEVVEVVTPYTTADLAGLRFSQSADVLYIWGGGCTTPRQPRTLTRSSHTAWTLDTYTAHDGPYREENIDTAHYLYPTANSGDISLYSSKAVFNADHVGSHWRLIHPGNSVSKRFLNPKSKINIAKNLKFIDKGTAAKAPRKPLQSSRLYTYGHFYVDLTPDPTDGWSGKITLQRTDDGCNTWRDVAVFTGSSSREFYEDQTEVYHRLVMKSGDYRDGSCQCKLYTLEQIGIVRITGYVNRRHVTAHVEQRIGQPAENPTQSERNFAENFNAGTHMAYWYGTVGDGATLTAAGNGSCVRASYDPNMVANSGFETAGGGAPDIFGSWTEGTGGTGAVIARTTTANEFYAGAAACKLTDGTTTADFAYVYQNFTVTASTKYILSCWTRGDGTNSGRIQVYDVTHSAAIVTEAATDIESTTFTQEFIEFTTPAACVSINVYLLSPKVGTAAWCCFDDVRLMPSTNCEVLDVMTFSTATHSATTAAQATQNITLAQYAVSSFSVSIRLMLSSLGTQALENYFALDVGVDYYGFTAYWDSVGLWIRQGTDVTGNRYLVDKEILPNELNAWHTYTFEVFPSYTGSYLGTCNIYRDGELCMLGIDAGGASAYEHATTTSGSASGIICTLKGVTADNQLVYVDDVRLGVQLAYEGELLDASEDVDDTFTVVPTSGINLRTNKWSEPAWSDYRGWPICGGFFQERLMCAGSTSKPLTVWGTASGDYTNFIPTTEEDGAITYSLLGTQMNGIRWMLGRKQLILGTAEGPWLLGASNPSEGLSPINVTAEQSVGVGSANLQPLETGASVLFVQHGGRKIRELVYSFDVDSYVAPEISIVSEHLFHSPVLSAAYAEEPEPTGYFVHEDGTMTVLTYERQQEVVAFSRWNTGPAGADDFESVAVIPSSTGREVWVSVRRTIGGAPKRFIERFYDDTTSGWETTGRRNHQDCGATRTGTATGSVTGALHLVGETVRIFADGRPIDDAVVAAGGSITLKLNGAATTAQNVMWGLGMNSELATMRVAIPGTAGSVQDKTKQITGVILRTYGAMGGNIAPANDAYPWTYNSNKLTPIPYRAATGLVTTLTSMHYGDVDVLPLISFDTAGWFWLVVNTSAPFTLNAIIYKILIGDD